MITQEDILKYFSIGSNNELLFNNKAVLYVPVEGQPGEVLYFDENGNLAGNSTFSFDGKNLTIQNSDLDPDDYGYLLKSNYFTDSDGNDIQQMLIGWNFNYDGDPQDSPIIASAVLVVDGGGYFSGNIAGLNLDSVRKISTAINNTGDWTTIGILSLPSSGYSFIDMSCIDSGLSYQRYFTPINTGGMVVNTWYKVPAYSSSNKITDSNLEVSLQSTGKLLLRFRRGSTLSGLYNSIQYYITTYGSQYFTADPYGMSTTGNSTTLTLYPPNQNTVLSELTGKVVLNDRQVLNADLVNTTGDANYTVTGSRQLVKIPTLTANRTLTLPAAANYPGEQLKIWNTNAAAFTVTYAVSIPVTPNGTTKTTIAIQTIDVLESDGTNWVKIN